MVRFDGAGEDRPTKHPTEFLRGYRSALAKISAAILADPLWDPDEREHRRRLVVQYRRAVSGEEQDRTEQSTDHLAMQLLAAENEIARLTALIAGDDP